MNTSDKISGLALVISAIAGLISWYSFYKTDELGREGFNRNYRPYLTAMNFAVLKKEDNKYYPKMNIVLIRPLNAPAFVQSEQVTFYKSTKNGDSLIFANPVYENQLLYPLENTQHTITSDSSLINHETAKHFSPGLLIRKIRLEYQWISDSSLKYYFESEWQYNLESHDWDPIYQRAN
jgi:hypothetical protein